MAAWIVWEHTKNSEAWPTHKSIYLSLRSSSNQSVLTRPRFLTIAEYQVFQQTNTCSTHRAVCQPRASSAPYWAYQSQEGCKEPSGTESLDTPEHTFWPNEVFHKILQPPLNSSIYPNSLRLYIGLIPCVREGRAEEVHFVAVSSALQGRCKVKVARGKRRQPRVYWRLSSAGIVIINSTMHTFLTPGKNSDVECLEKCNVTLHVLVS